MKNMLIAVAVTLVVAGGAGYWYGSSHGQTGMMLRNGTAQSGQFARGGARGTGQSGQGFLSGDITATDATSLTLHLQDGGSRIVLLSDSTTVMKEVAGARIDLAKGIAVTVIGATNTDGSVTARSIQIRPASGSLPFGR